jgi:GntR family transcriptional regulator
LAVRASRGPPTAPTSRGAIVKVRAGYHDSAYRTLARELRAALREGRYGDSGRLPTEAELGASHHVSRQTVRRAMQDLVSEGLVYRVPGRGTFPAPRDGRYLRQLGSIEDLMSLSVDTQLELVLPLARRVDLAAAGRLKLDNDVVSSVAFRRLHEGLPLCFTRVSLPPAVGRVLEDVPELQEVGRRSEYTVLGLLDQRMAAPVLHAEQSISVGRLPAEASSALGIGAGDAVLQIDRVYSDASGQAVELAVNWFHPDHYSYRVRLRRSVG